MIKVLRGFYVRNKEWTIYTISFSNTKGIPPFILLTLFSTLAFNYATHLNIFFTLCRELDYVFTILILETYGKQLGLIIKVKIFWINFSFLIHCLVLSVSMWIEKKSTSCTQNLKCDSMAKTMYNITWKYAPILCILISIFVCSSKL
jgi:hypothetical protein